MTTSPTSYLQTLNKNEAIAFVGSLQKVKEHLSHELQWITAQADQKITQLQGIEAILTEATTLGLISDVPVASADSSTSQLNSPVEMPLSSFNGSGVLEDINAEDINAEDIDAIDVEAEPKDEDEATTEINSNSDRRKVSNSKSATQSSSAQKSRGSKAKSTASAAKKSARKASLSAKSPDLKYFVRVEFQEQSFTDAVSQILEESSEPIGLSDVIAKLYGDLSNQDYQRAKISLTNVLSTGKNKGKWKSIGRGMYASNAVAAAL